MWLSSPSTSCLAAECRRRRAPPSACPDWRRWGGSRSRSLTLLTEKRDGGKKKKKKRRKNQFYRRLIRVYTQDCDDSRVGGSLTGFSDTKDFTQDESELDTASGKRTLVLVFPTAVLQDKLSREEGQSENWYKKKIKPLLIKAHTHTHTRTSEMRTSIDIIHSLASTRNHHNQVP